LTAYCHSRPLQSVQCNTRVSGIEQTIKCSTAGLHTPDGMAWEQLVLEDGVLQRLEANEQGLESFGDFHQAHQDYLRALVNDFDSWARFE
jgi:hypothetical protein